MFLWCIILLHHFHLLSGSGPSSCIHLRSLRGKWNILLKRSSRVLTESMKKMWLHQSGPSVLLLSFQWMDPPEDNHASSLFLCPFLLIQIEIFCPIIMNIWINSYNAILKLKLSIFPNEWPSKTFSSQIQTI